MVVSLLEKRMESELKKSQESAVEIQEPSRNDSGPCAHREPLIKSKLELFYVHKRIRSNLSEGSNDFRPRFAKVSASDTSRLPSICERVHGALADSAHREKKSTHFDCRQMQAKSHSVPQREEPQQRGTANSHSAESHLKCPGTMCNTVNLGWPF